MSQTAEFGPISGLAPSPSRASYSPWKSVVLLGLLAWIYGAVIARLVAQWWKDPNFSHGFFVPAFALYVLWSKRDVLRRMPLAPSWSGLAVLAMGLCLLVIGNLGAEIFLSRFSLLLVTAGLVICFLGWSYQREILFPWLFLLLMIPLPVIFFNEITFPLQLLASKLAAGMLQLVGVPVLREGNIIHIPAMDLEVAQACSGIRSLLSLTTLAIIYGYLMETSVRIRVLLALASVPIAVIANSLRIVGTGVVVQYWDKDLAEGFFHAFSGWLIFVVSLSFLFLLHKAVRIYPRRAVIL